MRLSTSSLISFAAATALALSLSITAQAQNHPAPSSTSNMPSTCGAGMEMGKGHAHCKSQMHKSMMSGMDSMKMMTLTGDTDKDFAMMMKKHHEMALEMAKSEIAHGKSAELKAMSRKIIVSQQKEIDQLDKWIAANK